MEKKTLGGRYEGLEASGSQFILAKSRTRKGNKNKLGNRIRKSRISREDDHWYGRLAVPIDRTDPGLMIILNKINENRPWITFRTWVSLSFSTDVVTIAVFLCTKSKRKSKTDSYEDISRRQSLVRVRRPYWSVVPNSSKTLFPPTSTDTVGWPYWQVAPLFCYAPHFRWRPLVRPGRPYC